jgi:hypothetical protein
MTIDNMTNENKSNLDLLNYFYDNKISVHIKLLRTNPRGKNIFLNGLIIDKLSDTLFLINERMLGKIRISLFEIKPSGVMEGRL